MTASLTPDSSATPPSPASPAPGSIVGPQANADPDVEILEVTKRFGDVTAVDRMTLRIARGAFYSLLGPSGCGKTTTLRMIAGFEQPTEGEILLSGKPIAGVPRVQAQRQHRLPALRAVPAHGRRPERRLRPAPDEGRQGRGGPSRRRGARDGPARRLRATAHMGDVRRAAAARRARPSAREPSDGAAPRRTARRARPEAPQGDAARAQGAPARGRHHVRVRDARPGRGAHHERRHRRHARRAHPADGRPDRALRATREPVRGGLHRDVELRRRDRARSRTARAATRRSGRTAVSSCADA